MTAEKPAAKAADSASAAAPSAGNAANPLSNAKHEAVLQAYIADPARVGWRAYSKVYPGSSEGAAKTAFSRLLKKADFAGRLGFLSGQITERAVDDTVMSAREVLQELSKLGRSSIKNVIVQGDDTGDVVAALSDLPAEHAATIQELTVETYVEGAGEFAREVKRVKVKLHDKRGPLRDLAQHHKLLTEKHEHTGKDGAPIPVEDKTERSDLDVARRIAFLLAKAARATIAGGGENSEGGDG
jgi:phage terminase small subunit